MQVFGDAIRFNVQATTSGWSYQEYRDNWLWFEELGLDVAYAVDHFVSESAAFGARPVWEGPTIITAMATLTSRIRCGLMVAGNTYRNPGILAKIAVTLDHVSGGRMELGMGSGHTELEHRMYDIPYYTQGKRLRMFAESAKIVRSLLDNERTTFDGEYYQFKDALCEPKPLQRPFPLLVGGIGEQLSMRIVAESADIWNNWTSPNPEEYRQKLDAFLRHCGDVGRDPSDIRRSIHIKPLIGSTESDIEARVETVRGFRSRGTPDQMVEDLLAYVKLGVSDFVFMFDYPGDRRSLELLAKEVAPRVRAEGPALLNRSMNLPAST